MSVDKSASMKEDFDRLLDWLDLDRELAGQKYETIRKQLIKIFLWRGASDPESLADETINRVMRRVSEVAGIYVGDPSGYFYGVAKKVLLEYPRRKRPGELSALLEAPDLEDVEPQFDCLERCLGKLTVGNRTLILQYYREQGQAKIDSRRALLEVFKLSPSALRVRIFRIRETLEECVRQCIELRE